MGAVIEMRDVHKTFQIPHEVHTTLVERLLSMLRPMSYERLEALRGVSVTIEQGEFVGLIGRNGSGKSTLLKIMAGLLVPDRGTCRIRGSMCELLELGLGFNPELTVRENVALYASILGYPRNELDARIEGAIDFADLDRFKDVKLKSLSTGMHIRLGFATALQADADILLLDEILAVGDGEFQERCMESFRDQKRRGKTIVLVSHDLDHIEGFCDRVILFNEGEVIDSGRPDAIISHYRHLLSDLRRVKARTG